MNRKAKNVAVAFTLATAVTLVGGCSVIDSHEQTNGNVFNSQQDVRSRLSQLRAGMDKAEVLKTLGVSDKSLQSLDRRGIKVALYGSENQTIQGSEEEVRSFLSGMEGYKFHYKDIDKDRSLSSSFRVKTESKGVDMTVYMVFKNGKLFDTPSVEGGQVRKKESDPIIKLDKIIGGSLGL